MNPTNVDVPAFHEGFSDLVALFLHFSYAEVVERAIRQCVRRLDGRSRFSPIWRASSVMRVRKVAGRKRSVPASIVGGLAAFDSDVLAVE